jgi:dipeptidase E
VNEVAWHIATKMETKDKKLLFIDTAAEVEKGDKQWLMDDRQSLVDIGFEVNDYTISDKTKDQLMKDLNPLDVIYVSGGNTFYLLQQAQQSGFIEVIQDLVSKHAKTYIGTSAGSIIAGPDTYPAYRLDKASLAPKLDGYAGFELVNFCILPHWGSDNFKELYLNHRLDHAYKEPQVPLITLTNSQYVHVNGNFMEIIDINRL